MSNESDQQTSTNAQTMRRSLTFIVVISIVVIIGIFSVIMFTFKNDLISLNEYDSMSFTATDLVKQLDTTHVVGQIIKAHKHRKKKLKIANLPSELEKLNDRSGHINVIPRPQYYKVVKERVLVNGNFQFETSSGSKVLLEACERYKKLMFGLHVGKSDLTLKSLHIHVTASDDTHATLQLGLDERYYLDLSSKDHFTLYSPTVWGALRGLETLSQMILFDFEEKVYWTYSAKIRDFPRFSHRGVLIDTARHYQPVKRLESLMDAMSHVKLNVLHWHIVDDQSFPLETRTYPKLWNAAYSKRERFTIDNVKHIVDYARRRGIRVVPEIDTPGHAKSWCVGYPELCVQAPACNTPLDWTKKSTMEFIEKLFRELTEYFPDQYFHVGCDEPALHGYDCWEHHAHVKKWNQENGVSKTADGYKVFVARMSEMAKRMNRTFIVWDEAMKGAGDKIDPKHVVIEPWWDIQAFHMALDHGQKFTVINSFQHSSYLDWDDTPWQKFYDASTFTASNGKACEETNPGQVIGGEVAVWTEHIDPGAVDLQVWPRAAAKAERFWSPHEVNDMENMEHRLKVLRCLFAERGIGSTYVVGLLAQL